jgi:glycosyltransferase involved in cell wall biosynthesis
MHRSGTSVTTRIINLLGAGLAGNLIPADIGNEHGQWESRAVQELHNGMLTELESDIYSPVNIAPDWFGSAAGQQWTGRIQKLFADEYSGSSFFVLKDPRIALFLPLWLEAMRKASIVPRFVLPFRDPDAVAASLQARESRLGSGNALPRAQGIAVWLRYVLAAERFTRGQVRSFVAFDQVLADWRAEFARIGRQLDVVWPNWQHADDAIDDFLDTGAHRHETADSVKDILVNDVSKNDVAGICRGVYASMQQAVLDPQQVLPAFDAAAQVVATAEDLFSAAVVTRSKTLVRERDDAVAYAKSLEHDRDRAIEYAKSLEQSRAQALEYAQSLEQSRNKATRKIGPEPLARSETPVFFTIASRNYLAYAVTLMQSVAQHHTDAPRYLILADRDEGDVALAGAPFVTIPVEALALPDFDAFAFRYTIMEFNTAIKPYAFSHLRRLHPRAGIVYLDPDVLVVAPLAQVETAFADGALAVLTPHLLEPIEDDRHPGEREILASGTYNCGFVAVGAHAEADRLIAWWADRLEFGACNDVAAGLFTDQKWIDLVPGLFADIHILRDDGYNLAYWNLAQRLVSRRELQWYAGKRPLAFVHFSGIDPDRPAQFSKHQNRHTQATIGELRPLYADYLARLTANGHADHRAKPYAFSRFADGELICDPVRAVYRRYFDKGAAQAQCHPFSMDRRLYDLPCDELPARIDAPITRLMYAVWKMRPDLQRVFHVGAAEGREGFIRWFITFARAELGIPESHFDPVHRALAARPADGAPDVGQNDLKQPDLRHRDSARHDRTPEKRHSMPASLRRASSRCLNLIRWTCRSRFVLHAYAMIPERMRNSIRRRLERIAEKPGINLVGYAHGEFGIGEILRRYAYTLQGSDVPFVVRNFDVGIASRQCDLSMRDFLSEECRYEVNLFCINADQLPMAREHLGDAVFAGHYNIGCWFWELEEFPEQWHGAIDLVDEIWVTSPFVRDAIAACTSKPVNIVPVALGVDLPRNYSRREFRLAEGAFLCLVSFDFNSFATRKNAEGAITAFRRAFAEGRSNVRLLIKTINGQRHPDELRRLTAVAAGDDRIEVRDGFLDRFGMWALQACCDCYVSLHRSEGFGLQMAECMLLGKPVVATGYSGNLAFMDANNSCLVSYSLVSVEEGEYPAWQGQHWAEPDIDQAAAYLKRLADEPAYARRIGEKAKASVRRRLSSEKSLAAMSARLVDIGEKWLKQAKRESDSVDHSEIGAPTAAAQTLHHRD